jgi:hypothetical protein
MPEINFFWDPLSGNILQERDETGAVTAEYTAEPGRGDSRLVAGVGQRETLRLLAVGHFHLRGLHLLQLAWKPSFKVHAPRHDAPAGKPSSWSHADETADSPVASSVAEMESGATDWRNREPWEYEEVKNSDG